MSGRAFEDPFLVIQSADSFLRIEVKTYNMPTIREHIISGLRLLLPDETIDYQKLLVFPGKRGCFDFSDTRIRIELNPFLKGLLQADLMRSVEAQRLPPNGGRRQILSGMHSNQLR